MTPRTGSRSGPVNPPRDHAAAAAAARAYADRATSASRRRNHGTQGDPLPWITLYMRRYRMLTGRPRFAGPVPVTVRVPKSSALYPRSKR